jgi:hypothetical protein
MSCIFTKQEGGRVMHLEYHASCIIHVHMEIPFQDSFGPRGKIKDKANLLTGRGGP